MTSAVPDPDNVIKSSDEVGLPNSAMEAGIFAFAAIKGQLVANHFMEVGHALPHWRTLYYVWIAGIALVLAAGHLL